VKSDPLVSVIISCYNHERYIKDCIESVVSQSYANIEILVIDDGSKDNSPGILKALAEKHHINLVLQENKGYSTTLNEAIQRSKGDYICPMGSDDIMMPDKTEKQVRLMEREKDISICGGNALIINNNNVIVNRRQNFPEYREINFDTLFRNTGYGIVAPTAMLRKSDIIKEGCYDPNIPLEDLYMWLKMTYRGYRMVGLNDVLIYYRKHDSNTYKNTAYMINSITKTLQPYEKEAGFKSVELKYNRSAFLNASKNKDRELAFSILKKIKLKDRFCSKVFRGILKLYF